MTNNSVTPIDSKSQRRQRAHIFAAAIILLHAYERYSHHHASWWYFLLAGLVFLLVAIRHHQLEHRFPKVDLVFFLIESSLSFIIAWEYFEIDKKYIPWLYVFAGTMQLVGAYIALKKRVGGGKRSISAHSEIET